ncbi:MAG: heat-inducible transcriptional repressor HrcA [Symploca sp. SIO2B6]|nr:heat-inducible transcriptional repressor HrcA [Symploca sp. SIO2B6]
MQVKLSDRHRHILRATIKQYVATARPVGSGALLEEYELNVSSATIRNAMGRLEKAGLLYQPYTSAGRIPSDSGYRIYVDQLLTPTETPSRQISQKLARELPLGSISLDILLRDAAHILANLSGYIALITFPSATSTSLRHLQLVPVDSQHIMLMVVFESYETDSILLNLPENLSPAMREQKRDADALEQELQILSNFLNAHLRGRSLQDISTLDWQELGQEFEQYAKLLQASLSGLKNRLQSQPGAGPMVISGMAEVLKRHPEFSELQHVQSIIHLLEEEQGQLLPLFFGSFEGEITHNPITRHQINENAVQKTTHGSISPNVTIRIGAEIPLEPIQTCALISTTYQRGESCVGSVGVLGPTRMLYENAIAFVEATANHLSEALA